MKNRKKNRRKPLPQGAKTAFKWLSYLLLGIIAFVISLSGGKSNLMLMLPLAVAIAVMEDEIPSAAAGCLLGLLTDIAADKLLGFTAFYLCVLCGSISALFRQLMRKNIFNFAWVSLITSGIYLYLDYYFFYRIWQKEGYEKVMSSVVIPSAVKTYFVGFAMFLAVYLLCRMCGRTRKLTIEQQNSMVDRM